MIINLSKFTTHILRNVSVFFQKWVHPILTQHGVENLKRQHQFPCALRHKRSFYYKWFGPDDWRNNKPPTDFQLKKQWNENKKKTILALFILPLRRYSSSIPLINFSNLDTQILVLELLFWNWFIKWLNFYQR